ncbi:MAG: vitamin K epoxide reductase family protein, partial [Solirubrobacterales bacterium]
MTDRSGRKPGPRRPSVLSHVIAGLIVGAVETRSRRAGAEGKLDERQMPGMQKLIEHHKKTLWAYWVVCFLGVWLLVSPATFSYGMQPVELPGGREIWLSAQTRASVLATNDVLCGLALIVLGWRSLTPNRPISQWLACGVGAWLNFAPLLFWAPRAVIYLNETLVGALVIALTILIPGMPNMARHMKMGPDKPPGWTFNPSSWPQRAIMIALGFAGWIVARHLGMYQLGYLERPWEPFFGAGSVQVLTSKISESLPVSDGSLGAFAYTFEFLMGWMGGQSRWRTMPWMVTFFGILVIPLGLVHISLVISQPVVVGHWCTLCLLAAAIMLPMIPLEIDEVVAMMQFTLGA